MGDPYSALTNDKLLDKDFKVKRPWFRGDHRKWTRALKVGGITMPLTYTVMLDLITILGGVLCRNWTDVGLGTSGWVCTRCWANWDYRKVVQVTFIGRRRKNMFCHVSVGSMIFQRSDNIGWKNLACALKCFKLFHITRKQNTNNGFTKY